MDTTQFTCSLAEKGLYHGAQGSYRGGWGPTVVSYINPVPSGLVLTGIVVSVSVTALMLSLTIRLYRGTCTLDLGRDFRQTEREGL